MPRIILLLLLAACSSPTDSQSPYPQNPAVSDAQGHPRDSTTFYFPAADSLHAKYIPHHRRPAEGTSYSERTSCQEQLEYASYTLFRFKAPVLCTSLSGPDTYRFLWLRSFDKPVLLTLRRQAAGHMLRTQFLSKPIPAFRPLSAYYKEREGSEAEKEKARQQEQEQMADPELQEALIRMKQPALLLTNEETTHYITSTQWRRFQELLQASGFYQLPACQPRGLFDGAHWMLEARTAQAYHMVDRHSPSKQDGFRKACEYLLDLSSARNERRY